MVLSAIILMILTVALAALMAAHFRPEVSQFEMKRLAERSQAYQQQLAFLKIYPGFKIFTEILALVVGILLAFTAFDEWQLAGILIALGAILLAFLLSKAAHRLVGELISQNLAWLIKYLGWTEALGRTSLTANEPKPHSKAELAHLVSGIDFMPEEQRDLIAAAVKFPDIKVGDIMTPRSKISFIKDTASLGPKVIDELYATGQKIFPVAHGDLENTLGVVFLDDIAVIAKGTQSLKEAAKDRPVAVERGQSALQALETMLRQGRKLVFVKNDNGKIVGMLEFNTVIELLLGQKIG